MTYFSVVPELLKWPSGSSFCCGVFVVGSGRVGMRREVEGGDKILFPLLCNGNRSNLLKEGGDRHCRHGRGG